MSQYTIEVLKQFIMVIIPCAVILALFLAKAVLAYCDVQNTNEIEQVFMYRREKMKRKLVDFLTMAFVLNFIFVMVCFMDNAVADFVLFVLAQICIVFIVVYAIYEIYLTPKWKKYRSHMKQCLALSMVVIGAAFVKIYSMNTIMFLNRDDWFLPANLVSLLCVSVAASFLITFFIFSVFRLLNDGISRVCFIEDMNQITYVYHQYDDTHFLCGDHERLEEAASIRLVPFHEIEQKKLIVKGKIRTQNHQDRMTDDKVSVSIRVEWKDNK